MKTDTLMLIVAPIAIPLSLILKSIYPLVLIGLTLSVLPDSLADSLVSLPIIEKADGFWRWLTLNSGTLAIGIALINLKDLVKTIKIMESDQRKHSFVVGSVINYLDVDDFDWDTGMKEIEKNELSLALLKKVFIRGIIGRLIGGEEGRRQMQGADPFNTRFKREGKKVSFKDDLSDALKNHD